MKKSTLYIIFFILAAFEAIGAAIWLMTLPAESINAVALGYSSGRLLMIVGLLLLGLMSLVVSLFFARMSNISARIDCIFTNRWSGLLMVFVVLSTWVLIFLPEYQWGRFGGYKSRLLPLLIWALLVGIEALLVGIKRQKSDNPGSFRFLVRTHKSLLKYWIIVLGGLTGILLIIAFFRIGLIPDIVYWNDFNVPLLGLQIIGSMAISIGLYSCLSRFGFFPHQGSSGIKKILPDIVLFLLIWGLAVVAWTQTNGPHSYFAPGPYPPNGERYPFSDAAGYDMAAHLATIGGGLGTLTYVDKPLYVAFLTLIYLVGGNQMNIAVGLQVAVIALLPAVVYLLGRKIHGRVAGLIAAGLIIFREINNINGTLWVLSANSKVFMTEMMVCLLLALFVFFLTAWVHEPEKYLWLMASGGSLGLAGLVRLNPFVLLPVIPVAILFLFWKKWNKVLLYSCIFIGFFAASVLPWMFQSYAVHNNFIFFTSTVRWVVLPQRTFYALNKPASQPDIMVTPTVEPMDQPEFASTIQPAREPTQSTVQPVNKTWNKITGVSRYVAAHFMHNLIDTMAIFPASLEFESLEKTIKSPGSFWSPDWDGQLPEGKMVLVYINLAIIALGMAVGWSRRRWAGLVPAGFLVCYSLATAAARTSSGRYFLPADWVGPVYFSVGIAQLYSWFFIWWNGKELEPEILPDTKTKSKRSEITQAVCLLVLFLVIGSTPVMLDRFITPRYTVFEKTSVISELKKKGALDSLAISETELTAFLKNPDAVVHNGLGLYPRFYEINKGEPDQFSSARGLPYPRLVMTVIGIQTKTNGILPLLNSPEQLPNGSDVIAIGCKGELNVDWFALIVEGPNRQVLLREPAAKWECPVRAPVCDDNRVCQ